ncbi:tyrosine-type recombinase/integrase [Sporomusa sphaeroides DSM 2875]|uniref:site-specific integrase n=1 Tax=Sporomusa sphaeroides TaxID=47679 RepID=UPI00203077C5|nr:site-specific integrase [Sporomusa sphaeroides]MCM0758515.1 tyrosine-type recombinase/integrase [Sporomusa sphaeroides DSM 2875]
MANLVNVSNRNLMAGLSEQAKNYIAQSKADNTVKSYKSDWADFVSYCNNNSLDALPADEKTVISYITELAQDKKVSTINRRISAISQAHQAAGYQTPTQTFAVRALLKGIKREKGTMPDKKQAAGIDDVRLMVETLGDKLIDIRDRALVLIGFAGAFRRSELVNLTIEDIKTDRNGITITLRHSKTDQEGQGIKKGIPYGSNPDTCPVRALLDWLNASCITEGAIFRSINRHSQVQPNAMSDKAVALIVKKLAEVAGLDASQYSGHSLRSGFITTAADYGVDERSIMKQSGHKSLVVMRGYIQEATLFRHNAASQVGL